MNCVERSRRCVGKKVKNREEEVYIGNLVARLTVLYRALSRFGRNSADLAECGRNGRLWRNLAETADCGKLRWNLWQIAVETGGNRWRVCKVSRRCPVTAAKKLNSELLSALINLKCLQFKENKYFLYKH